MNKKAFIVVLFVLVLLSINFSVAHEIDNSTIEDSDSTIDNEILSAGEADQPVQKTDSQLKTQIDVESNTTFDVIGDYFKVKLSDENGTVLKNTKVTFTVAGNSYTKTTNNNGIASLQLKLNDGSYKITTKFLGNSKYKASSNTTMITMDNTRVVAAGLSNSEIQRIIDNAKDQNVILFKGASYSNVNLVITKRLTLVSNSNTLLKSSSTSPVISIKGKGASSTIIKGFKIQGEGNGIVVSNSDLIRIVDNDITTAGNAIVATGTKYLNITKNNIVKNSKSGIVIGDTVSTYIFDNKITNNGGNAIEMAKSDKVYIHGNTVSGNNNGIVFSKSVNGVNYGEGPKNVYINKNTISKQKLDGILINNAGNNINIKFNSIVSNENNGISMENIGSNSIQSNVISDNWIGINFFGNYQKQKDHDISYNAILSNYHMEVEAKETYYQDTGNRLELGENWYTDRAGICPKIKTNNLQFAVKQIGPNIFQATFKDSNGNIASLLPDRTLSYKTNNGKTMSITVSGGVGVFTVDAKDGDLVRAIVDNSRRDNEYDGDTPSTKPINGVSPSYDYPQIPYDDEGMGNGDGDGTGDGNGNGNGTSENGNGLSNHGSSENTGNSTQSQKADPSDSGSNQVNDVSQSYETQTTTFPESASGGSSGDSGNAGAQSQQQSVAKQIIIDEDEFFRVTGMTFIVLLMILTIAYYYRDDIREMNSKR